MADRKQFLDVETANADLLQILKQSQGISATEEELREQRISFAFGNALGSQNTTKESVRESSKHLRLLD